MTRMIKSVMPAATIALLLLCAPDARACPGCKEALADAQGSDSTRVRDGYSWSVLMMIGTPFSLLTAGAFAVARAVKRGSLPEF